MCLISGDVGYSRLIKSACVDFEQFRNDGNPPAVAEGTIYLSETGNITVNIRKPKSQWIISEENDLIFYYPADREAVVIEGGFVNMFPSFRAFVDALQDDYGLTGLGYTIIGHRIIGDTLVTHWQPPRYAKPILNECVLSFVDNKISLVELKGEDGSTLVKSAYEDYFQWGASFLPLQISTTRYLYQDTIVERFVFSNVQLNLKLPAEIENFRMPGDTRIRRIKW